VLVAGHSAVVLADGPWAAWCGAAACACATVAALIALTRASGGLRPLALGGAWALAFAWPLWGALPAAAAATLATAFVVRWGAGGARSRRFDVAGAATLAAVALVLLGAAFTGPAARDDALAGEPRAGDAPTAAARTGNPGTDAARRDGARTGEPRTDGPRTETDGARMRDPGTDGARADEGADTLRGSSARTAASAAGLVRSYYRALDRRDFDRAWALLSPAVQSTFGGYDRWRSGFATTLSSRPTALRVRGGAVELVLVARDRAACGVLEQRFAVRWQLDEAQAASIGAEPLGAPSCSPT
jgi:hypothetical protein